MALLTPDEIVRRLKRMPAFRRVAEPALRLIADLIEIQYANQGETLYRVGQPANKLYIVESGLVNFEELNRFGARRTVGRVGPGEVFGIQAFLRGIPYDQTAIVAEPVTLFALDREALERLMNEHPYVRRQLDIQMRRRRQLWRSTFHSQGQDEVVLVYARPHWIVLFQKIAGALIFLFAAIVISAGLALFFQQTIFAGLLISFSVIALALIVLVWSYWDWWFDAYIVTNQRVISLLRRPYIQERLIEAPIARIQNISYDFPSLSSRLLGWSDVSISTAGGKPIVFPKIADGPYIHAVIAELVAELRASAAVQQLEARMTEIERLLRDEPAAPAGGSSAPPSGPVVTNPLLEAVVRFLDYFYPRQRFMEENNIVYRKHWSILVRRTIWLLIPLILVGLLMFMGVLSGAWAILDPLEFILAGFFIVIFGGLLWQYEDWRNDLYILTESAVIDLDRKPLYLGETAKQAGYDAIQDVSYEIPNIIAETLGYGNVLIQTAGQQGQMTWDHVSNPRQVRLEINERITQFRDRREKRQLRDRDQDLVRWFKKHAQVKGHSS